MLLELKQKVQEQIERQRGGSAEDKLKDLRKIEELTRKVKLHNTNQILYIVPVNNQSL